MKRRSEYMTRQVLGFFGQRLRVYPGYVAGILIALPITIVTSQYVPPLILANVLRRLSTGDYVTGQPWQSFGQEFILYGVLLLFGSFFMWRVVDYFVWNMEGRVMRDIAQIIFDKLVDHSADFHANRFGGALVSQSNKLISAYVRLADSTVYGTSQLIIGLVATSVIMLPRAPLYVLCLLIFAALYIVTATMVTRPVQRMNEQHAKAESEQTGYLADAVTNVMAIKSFAGELHENAAFGNVTENTRSKLIRLSRYSQMQMAYFSGMTSLISIAAFVVAVVSVVSDGADVSTVFLILAFTTNIVNQLFTFSMSSLKNFNRSIGDGSDMVRILNMEQEIKDPANPQPLRISRGAIRFDDVTFTHADAPDPIFKHLNIRIKPGEKVGLVGHSGSGKTSLTRILLRYSDIDSGIISIDGQDISKTTQRDLRSKISYVPQEPLLFHRSIRENIAYGNPNASDEEIEATARKANAHEFIETLPKGYATLVGERGVKLSGGQRQRVAIARAMIKNAPILVLDEATSALDSESEALIQDALWKLMEGRTAIVIAHRLSTIQHMDRIIVMDEGDIVEEGSHKELVTRGGVYAKLWARQSGGFLED
jgi:ATP-binding cassette subfamily B protein